MMDSYEVYQRYLNAKKRFNEELNAIQKAYISSNLKFKEGDIVKIQKYDVFERDNFTLLMVIDTIRFFTHRDGPNDDSYRNPTIEVLGRFVDEEGYVNSPSDAECYAEDVIEVTNIRYKGLRR